MNSNSLKSWFYPKIPKISLRYLKKVIQTNFINEGPYAKKFEKLIAKLTNRKYCSVTSSGSTALVTSLLALGVKKNDEVLVPGFSFIATVNAIKLIGAIPIFIDVNVNTFCACEIDLLKKLKNKKKYPKYLVTVEVNGRSPNYKEILKICKKYKIKLITDSAESIGSNYYNRALGSIGEISTTSFSPNKILSTGQGGAIMTNSLKLYKNILSIKYQGNHIRGDGGSDKYNQLGLNFKLSDLNCVIGISQIIHVEKRLENTERNYDTFKKYLKGKYNIKFLPIQKNGKRLWIDCLVLKNRNKFLEFLKKEKIAFREFWLPMNMQKSMNEHKVKLPNVNFISKRGVWLASNFDIKKRDIIEKFKK